MFLFFCEYVILENTKKILFLFFIELQAPPKIDAVLKPVVSNEDLYCVVFKMNEILGNMATMKEIKGTKDGQEFLETINVLKFIFMSFFKISVEPKSNVSNENHISDNFMQMFSIDSLEYLSNDSSCNSVDLFENILKNIGPFLDHLVNFVANKIRKNQKVDPLLYKTLFIFKEFLIIRNVQNILNDVKKSFCCFSLDDFFIFFDVTVIDLEQHKEILDFLGSDFFDKVAKSKSKIKEKKCEKLIDGENAFISLLGNNDISVVTTLLSKFEFFFSLCKTTLIKSSANFVKLCNIQNKCILLEKELKKTKEEFVISKNNSKKVIENFVSRCKELTETQKSLEKEVCGKNDENAKKTKFLTEQVQSFEKRLSDENAKVKKLQKLLDEGNAKVKKLQKLLDEENAKVKKTQKLLEDEKKKHVVEKERYVLEQQGLEKKLENLEKKLEKTMKKQEEEIIKNQGLQRLLDEEKAKNETEREFLIGQFQEIQRLLDEERAKNNLPSDQNSSNRTLLSHKSNGKFVVHNPYAP